MSIWISWKRRISSSRSMVKPSRSASFVKASYAPVSQSISVQYTSNVTHSIFFGSGMAAGLCDTIG